MGSVIWKNIMEIEQQEIELSVAEAILTEIENIISNYSNEIESIHLYNNREHIQLLLIGVHEYIEKAKTKGQEVITSLRTERKEVI